MALTFGKVTGRYDGARSKNKSPEIAITSVMNEQNDMSQFGLSQETLQELVGLREYFNNIKAQDVSVKSLEETSQELRALILKCVKEKVANVTGRNPEDFRITYYNDDGMKCAKIVEQKKYTSNEKTIGFYRDEDNKNGMPNQVLGIIWVIDIVDEINDKLERGRITEQSALKTLNECFNAIDEFGSYEIRLNNNGRLIAINYNENKKIEEKEGR